MTDKSELKLAPGSEWNNETIVSADGEEVWVQLDKQHVCICEFSCETNSAPVADILAVIRAAGLDPEFERLKVLEAENAELRARLEDPSGR